MTQRVKRLPAMRETWVRSLDREDPLEKEMATDSSILAWGIHGRRSLVGYSPLGRKELDTTERLHFHFHLKVCCISILKISPLSNISFASIFSCSGASLIAQLVKNLPAVQETLV